MVTKPSNNFGDHMPYVCRNCLTEYWNGYSEEFCSMDCAKGFEEELADIMTEIEIGRKRLEEKP